MEIGSKVLGYVLEALLGEGGMGRVYRAVHAGLGQRVAVKVLDPVLARNAELRERFLQEARIQVGLRHPGIVAVLTADSENDEPAFVMELVEGRTLAEVVARRGALPLAEALTVFRQVLEAVGYAHARGVVHRDLKPGNVMVQADGTAKVMDFGIARVLGDVRRTRAGTEMGSAHYMAPEQVLGRRDVDQRADVYALGATFFEALTGRAPFVEPEGDDVADPDFIVKTAQVQQAPPDARSLRPELPAGVAAALLKALAKDPAARFQSCAEFWAALSAGAGQPGAPLEAPAEAPAAPDASAAPPAGAARRWSAPAVVVAVLVALIVVAGLVLAGKHWLRARAPGAAGPAAAATGADTPDRVAEAAVAALRNRRPAELWALLPDSYQRDVQDLVGSFAAGLDRDVFEHFVQVLDEAAVCIDKHGDRIAAAYGSAASVDVGAVLGRAVGAYRLAQAAKLTDYDALTKLDLPRFLAEQGPALMTAALELVRALDPQGYGAFEAALATFAARVSESGDEDATVELTLGTSLRPTAFTKVDGRWVPEELAAAWGPKMTAARRQMARAVQATLADKEQTEAQLAKAMAVLKEFERSGDVAQLTQLLTEGTGP